MPCQTLSCFLLYITLFLLGPFPYFPYFPPPIGKTAILLNTELNLELFLPILQSYEATLFELLLIAISFIKHSKIFS